MILCSSGLFFQPDKPHAESILDLGPQLAVDGIEVLVLRDMVGHLADVVQTLSASTLRFPAVHAPKIAGSLLPRDEGVRQVSEALTFAKRIGARVVVLHLWDLPESDSDLPGRLEAATVAADLAEDAGVTLAIETIPCSVSTPLANVRRVIDHEPRLRVALDTEFLAHHDEFEAALNASWLWSDGVVRHIHLKDYTEGLFDTNGRRRYRALGDGTVDFAALFETLERYGYRGAVSLEAAPPAPTGGCDIAATARSLAQISQRPWSFSAAPRHP